MQNYITIWKFRVSNIFLMFLKENLYNQKYSKISNIMKLLQFQITVFYYDPSDIILICWFAAPETFLIINNEITFMKQPSGAYVLLGKITVTGQCMYDISTARAIQKHRIHLLSYHSRGTLMSYTDHSAQRCLKSYCYNSEWEENCFRVQTTQRVRQGTEWIIQTDSPTDSLVCQLVW